MIVGLHVDGAFGERDLDRGVGRRHPEPALDRLGVGEGGRQQVGLTVPLVETSAVEAERLAEVGDDRVGEPMNRLSGLVRSLDLADQLLDALHQQAEIDRSDFGVRAQGESPET